MGCSEPPMSARPPALSVCTALSWREMSAAVAPRLCSRRGSSATCTSRVTPPTRATEPTPRTPSRLRAMVLSTNQLRASSSRLLERTVKAKIGAPDRLILLTMGSRKSLGRSLRTCCTALRTSSTASWVDRSRRNSAVTVTLPSCTLVEMFLRPCSDAMAFSSLRATSVSNWAGAAPGRLADTDTVGSSRSGNCCTFIALKDMMPASVSSTNSMTAGMGFLIDQAETFMCFAPYLLAAEAGATGAEGIFGVVAAGLAASTTLTRSPSLKKPPPLATSLSSGFTPL